jgi:hypothetical protein
MDLRTTEQLQGTLWQCVKICAFFCFFVAGALLLTSLLLPHPPLGGFEAAQTTNATTLPR